MLSNTKVASQSHQAKIISKFNILATLQTLGQNHNRRILARFVMICTLCFCSLNAYPQTAVYVGDYKRKVQNWHLQQCNHGIRNEPSFPQCRLAQLANNLASDGILWICYPKGSSKRYRCEFNRDTGWTVRDQLGFEPVRQVAIDDDWNALRFRRVQHIKTLTRSKEMALTREGKERTRG